MVYSGLTIIEFNFYPILKFIPFYSFIRVYLSIWLILPQTQGSNFIYQNYIEPFLSYYEADFDNFVNRNLSLEKLGFVGSYIRSVFGYSNVESQTQVKDITEDPLTKSYFDVFVQSFYQTQTSKDSAAKTENNLFESLFGVFDYLPLGAGASTVEHSTIESKGTETPSNFATSSTASNDTDYDVVGKDDYENVITGDEKKDISKNGWFSWWSEPSKTKTA